MTGRHRQFKVDKRQESYSKIGNAYKVDKRQES